MLKTLMITTAFALTATAALGAPMLSRDGRVTSAARLPLAGGVRHAHVPSLYSVVYDSIGSGYNCCSGWTISAVGSVIGAQFWPAIQITLPTNESLTQLDVGVGYVTGTNAVQLAIYKDKKGLPGKMCWSGDASNLPTFGSTSTATVSATVKKCKFKANKPFWVAVQTDANSSDTWDAWNVSNTTNAPLAENTGSGWTSSGTQAAGAVIVYGN